MANVHEERFPVGQGWSLEAFHATMVAPRVMPIIGMPEAWTPGTDGPVVADVVRPVITTEADRARYHGHLRGKIVLSQPARDVRMLEYGDGMVLRYGDQEGRWRAEAMAPARPVPEGEPVRRSTSLLDYYRAEGVVAVFDRGPSSDLVYGGSDLSWVQQRADGGTLFVQAGAAPEADPAAGLPQITLAVEHYNRMVRLLDHDVPVRVELDVRTRFTPETSAHPNGFNIIGEIPGTDLADQIVLVGAHFDSWHGGTGATDNAAGVGAMMEALRIFEATGVRPRRTIRIGLWGGEEEGLLGSSAYAAAHLGTPNRPKPELAKTTAYFNLDNGTGPIRGVWTQGNAGARALFQAWSKPLADLGVDMISPRSVTSTDHVPFDRLGIPAFQFVQERYEYNSRTHHSNMDLYDRLQPDDLKQAATVAAVFAWQAATREAGVPRRADRGRR